MTTTQCDEQATGLQRRNFLHLVVGAGVSGGLGLSDSVLLGSTRAGKGLNAAAFEPLVGSKFQIQGHLNETQASETQASETLANETLVVELEEASAQAFDPNRPRHVRQDPFMLIFRAPRDTRFPDQICRIWHPKLGAIETFVSPVGPNGRDGVSLQAVFG